MEIWKDINGYEGFYQVSNYGNVKSLERLVWGRGRKSRTQPRGAMERKKVKNRVGYLMVQLRNDDLIKTVSIHRLVAIHFIPNPENKLTVNHISGIKTDNRVENLEWATQSENCLHALANKLMIPLSRGRHGRAKVVLDTQTGIYYDCGKDAAEAKGIPQWKFHDSMKTRGVNKTGLLFV